MVNEINNTSCNNILISSENLLDRPFSELYSIVDSLVQHGFKGNFKIVIYLRRQDDLLSSYYSQYVKQSTYSGSISEFKEYNDKLDFYSLLTKLESRFKSNIIVRVYEKEQFINGNIFDDFLVSLFDISVNKKYDLPKKDSNPRLDVKALDYKRIVNSYFSNKYIDPFFETSLLNYSNIIEPLTQKAFQQYNLLSSTQKKELLIKYNDINKLVAKEYLGRDSLFYNGIIKNNDAPTFEKLDIYDAFEISKYLLEMKFKKKITDDILTMIIAKAMIKFMNSNNNNLLESYKGLSIDKAIEISKHLLSQVYSDNLDDRIVKLLVGGTIGEIIGNLNIVTYLNEKEFLSLPNVYRLPTITPKYYDNIDEFKLKDDTLSFTSTGKIPKIILPKFQNPNHYRKLRINIVLSVEQPTILKVLYRSIDDEFNNINSKSIDVSKLYNNLYFDINSNNNIDRILLVPGLYKGKYIIHSLDIRGVESES